MKPKFFLKGAVVAMAAFGAFAFNGSANAQQEFTRSDTCESISAECSDSGIYTCRIEVYENGPLLDVHDFSCLDKVTNFNDEPVQWSVE